MADKKVKVRIPLTRSEKEDVYVAINGESYLIKRGEEVEVPASVAEVLQHKEVHLPLLWYECESNQNCENILYGL